MKIKILWNHQPVKGMPPPKKDSCLQVPKTKTRSDPNFPKNRQQKSHPRMVLEHRNRTLIAISMASATPLLPSKLPHRTLPDVHVEMPKQTTHRSYEIPYNPYGWVFMVNVGKYTLNIPYIDDMGMGYHHLLLVFGKNCLGTALYLTDTTRIAVKRLGIPN